MIKLKFKTKKEDKVDETEYRLKFIIRAVKNGKMTDESFKPNMDKVLKRALPRHISNQLYRLIREEPEEGCYDYVYDLIKRI